MKKVNDSIPLLSVILPAYNVEKYIAQCIDSILNQSFSSFELLIADDGSNDNTKKIIDSYNDKRIIISHNSINCGKTKTVNRLFLITKGKYITIHDSDDWSKPQRFEKQLAWLESNSNHIMCGTGYLTFNEQEQIINKSFLLAEYNQLQKAIKESSQFHCPTIIFKKDSLNSNLVYREYFKDHNEDTDLAYRLFQKGSCTNIDELLYCYRILENSLCRKEFSLKRNKNFYKVVAHLAQQRELQGYDDLMKNNTQLVDKFYNSCSQQYIDDNSLIYREGAAYYMYWQYYKKAIQYSLKAIKASPFKFINWRTLLYVLRKTSKNLY